MLLQRKSTFFGATPLFLSGSFLVGSLLKFKYNFQFGNFWEFGSSEMAYRPRERVYNRKWRGVRTFINLNILFKLFFLKIYFYVLTVLELVNQSNKQTKQIMI